MTILEVNHQTYLLICGFSNKISLTEKGNLLVTKIKTNDYENYIYYLNINTNKDFKIYTIKNTN